MAESNCYHGFTRNSTTQLYVDVPARELDALVQGIVFDLFEGLVKSGVCAFEYPSVFEILESIFDAFGNHYIRDLFVRQRRNLYETRLNLSKAGRKLYPMSTDKKLMELSMSHIKDAWTTIDNRLYTESSVDVKLDLIRSLHGWPVQYKVIEQKCQPKTHLFTKLINLLKRT